MFCGSQGLSPTYEQAHVSSDLLTLISYTDYSFQAICELIQQFAPCMNDYLYAYDLSTDNFYITERAVERFLIPTNRFQQVVDTLKTFVYPEDFPVLQTDLREMLDYKKDTHNLEYRWLGRDGSPIWINCRGRLLKNRRENPAIMIGCINDLYRFWRKAV